MSGVSTGIKRSHWNDSRKNWQNGIRFKKRGSRPEHPRGLMTSVLKRRKRDPKRSPCGRDLIQIYNLL